MSYKRANVQRNDEKARPINRRTYLRTENNVKTLRREKRWEEKLSNVAKMEKSR